MWQLSAPASSYGSTTDASTSLLLLLGLYACWGSAIPAMKLMVETVPPLGGAALVFLVAGLVLCCGGASAAGARAGAVAALGGRRCVCCWWAGRASRWWR